jgi:hypothetical protein
MKKKRKKDYYRDRRDSAGQLVGRLPVTAKTVPAYIMAQKRAAKVKQRLIDLAPRCASTRELIRAAGCGITTFYKYLKLDDDFRKALELEQMKSKDLIREEISNRAIHGYLKPVVSAGKLVTFERVKSDGLLTLMAKAHLDEYRDGTASFSAAGLAGAAERLVQKFATILERERARGLAEGADRRGSDSSATPLDGVGEG